MIWLLCITYINISLTLTAQSLLFSTALIIISKMLDMDLRDLNQQPLRSGLDHHKLNVGHARVEPTTPRLWDQRSVHCAKPAACYNMLCECYLNTVKDFNMVGGKNSWKPSEQLLVGFKYSWTKLTSYISIT